MLRLFICSSLIIAMAGISEAVAQANVLKECGSRYQAKKAANELGGQSWQEFLKECRATLTEAPAAEAKPAEAAKPAEPAKPAETAAPAEPAKPAETAKPAEAAAPEKTKEKTIAATARDKKNYAVVRVFYGTDRNYRAHVNPADTFGADRGQEITFGYCDVSIPRDHRMGDLEAPSIWRLEFREDPSKHVVLLKTALTSKDKFFSNVVRRVKSSDKNSAFLFVHGYNVTFESAAKRTAQISYDLGFDGAPVFYSWPSQGVLEKYLVDETNVEWTQVDLRNFLEEFISNSEAKNIYLIAHSMGNRALTRVLASLLSTKPDLRSRVREVILTAPDIDADVFKRDIVPALTAVAAPVTLYSSSKDLALATSEKLHAYPRAGDSGQGLVIAPGIETIDASSVDTSLLGHSYFAEERSVLSDLYYLIHDGERPDKRFGLIRVDDQGGGQHWIFKK